MLLNKQTNFNFLTPLENKITKNCCEIRIQLYDTEYSEDRIIFVCIALVATTQQPKFQSAQTLVEIPIGVRGLHAVQLVGEGNKPDQETKKIQ